MNVEYINYRSVSGNKYRDVYELKPCNEFGGKEFDWVGTEVLTPNCDWETESKFCTEFCEGCAVAQEVRDLIGE